MKKNLFKLLSLLLALCLVLCACGVTERDRDDDDDEDTKAPKETEAAPSDEELILGTWKADVDLADYLDDYLIESMGDELAQYFDLTGVSITLTLTFDEDGTCTLAFEDEDLDAFIDETAEVLLDGAYIMMEALLVDELDGKSLDAYLEEYHMTFEQLMAASGVSAEALKSAMLDSVESLSSTTDYRLSNGILDLDGDMSAYELDGDSLTIYAPVGSDDPLYDVLFPLELVRSTKETSPEKEDDPIDVPPATRPNDEAQILGDWKLEMECGGLYNMIMGALLGGELPEGVDFTGLKLTVYYTFKADGTYELSMKDEDLEAFAQEASEKLMPCMRDLMETMLASELGGMTLDEFLQEQDMTFEELLEASGVDADELAQSMLDSMEVTTDSGTYALESGMLVLADSEQPYELDGDTLTLYAPEGLDDEMTLALAESLYPMVLTRVD